MSRLFNQAVNQATNRPVERYISDAPLLIEQAESSNTQTRKKNIPDGSIINNGEGFYYFNGNSFMKYLNYNKGINKYELLINEKSYTLFKGPHGRVYIKYKGIQLFLILDESYTNITFFNKDFTEETVINGNITIIEKPEKMKIKRTERYYTEPEIPDISLLMVSPENNIDSLSNLMNSTYIRPAKKSRRTADSDILNERNVLAERDYLIEQAEEDRLERLAHLESLRRKNNFGFSKKNKKVKKNNITLTKLHNYNKYLNKLK
jgi:hypothetical protein